MAAKTKEVEALTAAIEAKTKLIGELGVEIVAMKEDLDDTGKALLEDKKFTAELADGKKTLEKTIKTLDASEKESTSIAAAAVTLAAALGNHEECAAKSQIYHAASKKCIDAAIPATAFIPKVAHAMFNNADGREGGYINSRVVKVTKTRR